MTPSGLPAPRHVAGDRSSPPTLMVVVDTEEEFEWSAPFSRANTSVRAMKHVARAHAVFDRYRVRPTYVIDYPVAGQTEGVRPLQELLQSGVCAIGAHLHPWVNPPFTEVVNAANSFTCNLPVNLQFRKLQELTRTIADRFELSPRVFKAGRYGLGAATVKLLENLGYHVDTSVSPRMDFRNGGGPCFAEFDSRPFFLTPTLMECPCTIDYIGWMGPAGRVVHEIAQNPRLSALRLPGILARLRMVNRVMLSPEGNTLSEMCALARTLHSRGLRVFTLSYHSPSLEPGHTPYVRTGKDLEQFMSCLDGFCEFFFGELQGVAGTPEELRARMLLES
jgi:hypothetical protein